MISGTPDDAIASALSAAIADTEYEAARLRIRARERLAVGSSHLIEVLHCTDAKGGSHRILCKYGHQYAFGGPEHVDGSHGHRKGVSHEAWVYKHLLQPSGLSCPRFYGAHAEDHGRTWLFIEQLEGAIRVSKATPYRNGLVAAATWIGRFHRIHQAPTEPGLEELDAEYFKGWAERTALLLGRVTKTPGWVHRLAGGAHRWAQDLAEGSSTAIHGEYYMRNILFYEGDVYPIDWESAARAAGEIDLAVLTDDVEPELTDACVAAYRAARWPSTEPAGFEERFQAARLYLHLRWLGEHERPTARQYEWRLPRLRREAASLGLV